MTMLPWVSNLPLCRQIPGSYALDQLLTFLMDGLPGKAWVQGPRSWGRFVKGLLMVKAVGFKNEALLNNTSSA